MTRKTPKRQDALPSTRRKCSALTALQTENKEQQREEHTWDALGVSRSIRVGPSNRVPIIKCRAGSKSVPKSPYLCCLSRKPLPFLLFTDCPLLGSHGLHNYFSLANFSSDRGLTLWILSLRLGLAVGGTGAISGVGGTPYAAPRGGATVEALKRCIKVPEVQLM